MKHIAEYKYSIQKKKKNCDTFHRSQFHERNCYSIVNVYY